MVPSVILPMVLLVANGTQWYHFDFGAIGRTLNDIGIPLVPLVVPCTGVSLISSGSFRPITISAHEYCGPQPFRPI